MRGFFNGLILGIILGAVAYWFTEKKAGENPAAQARYEHSAAELRTNVEETAHTLSDAMKAKLETLGLRTDQIKDELAKNGQVVRRKAEDIGDEAVNAASDARAVTEIKAKYAMDATLSAWDISVSCDHGHVRLAGTVSAPEDVGRAVALALDADGVRDATSVLVVKSNQTTNTTSGGQ